MKFALLPFCAIAFAVLSIAQFALAHFELMTPAPVLLTVSAYSSLIAASVWLDRRSAQQVQAPCPLDSNDVVAALAARDYDITNVVALRHSAACAEMFAHGKTSAGMTSSQLCPSALEWLHTRSA